jgi:hypothetical protein
LPRLAAAQVVDQSDVADPSILPVSTDAVGLATTGQAILQSMSATRYLRFGTTDRRSNVPAAVSANLVDWMQLPDALPIMPSWATQSVTTTWAPVVVATAKGWVLFFTTEDAASGRECIGRATASRPQGPYIDRSGGPLVCQESLGGSLTEHRAGQKRPALPATVPRCPCRETSTGPFIAGGANQLSPGGLDTFTDTKGGRWASFSTFLLVPNPRYPGRFFRDRVLDIAPITSS